MRRSLLAGLALATIAGTAQAQVLTEWVLFGEPGDQAATASSNDAACITGLDMRRGAGVTATAAGNSISASGWHDLAADDYFSFGFTVGAGANVDLGDLVIATRSSNTGPANLALRYSVDGYASNLATIVNSGTFFTNSIINLASLTGLTGTVEFRIYVTDTVSANGGMIGSAGTLRISEYFDGVNFFPVYFTGTVNSCGSPAIEFCNGNVGCPCVNDNDGSLGVAGCANSAFASGCRITVGGTFPAATTIVITNAQPSQFGIVLRGTNSFPAVPIFDGLLCVGGNTWRSNAIITSPAGTGVSDTLPMGPPGVQWNYQFWYRDVGLCAGSNLSNAAGIVW